jgi:hypothetical protein
MKKVIVLFVLMSGIASAQFRDKNLHFGILLSANSTAFKADPGIGEISSDRGYGASAFLRLKALIFFGEVEIGYMEHKVIVAPVLAGTTVNSNYSLSGLDLTGILGWRVIGIGSLGNFRLFAGLNYGNYSKVSIESNGAKQNDSSINTGNTSVVGGLGLDLWRIVFNAKYLYGVSNLSSIKDQTLQSRGINVSLGLKF